MNNHAKYAAALCGKVLELFDEDSESDYHIDFKELTEGDNLTDFIHALANSMPNLIYQRISNDEKSNLEFNHLANQLVFQYSKQIDEEIG